MEAIGTIFVYGLTIVGAITVIMIFAVGISEF